MKEIESTSGKKIIISTDPKACSRFGCRAGQEFTTKNSPFLRPDARQKNGTVLGVNERGVWVELKGQNGSSLFGLAPFKFLIEKSR